VLLANIHDYIRLDNFSSEQSYSIANYYDKIKFLAQTANATKKIGFYGQPDQKTIDIFKEENFEFIDLDINFHNKNHKIVPDVYCHIIRDILNNAIALKDDLEYVLCTTGRDKCDQGRGVRDILCQMDFKLIDASNYNLIPLREPIISRSRGNLRDRVIRIMELVYSPLTEDEIKYYTNMQCNPVFNFHGVPPQDIDLLSLFPEETHIQGWTRLVEMGIPYKVELEWEVDNELPTVYFSQSFCNKQLMSEYLAKKHNGLYVDGHGFITNSIKAKLEAFISLRNENMVFKKEIGFKSYLSGAKQ